MILTKIKSLSGNARVLKISLIGIVGQSWYESEDESVTELVHKINDFNAIEGDEIHCMINSQGGNYFAGVHLFNTLKESKAKVTTKNMGLAASAASAVFMAGDVRVCYPGSITMAHNPLVYPGLCNSDDLTKLSADLDDVAMSMKSLYLSTTGIDESKLDELLKSEKNMTPAEALENGFATEISEETDYQAISEDINPDEERKAELLAISKRNPDEKNTKASADNVISACEKAGLGDLVAQFHQQEFSNRVLSGSIGSVKAIKDVCAATSVDFESIKQHIFSPSALFKAFAIEVSANRDDDDIGVNTTLGDTNNFVIKPINGCN